MDITDCMTLTSSEVCVSRSPLAGYPSEPPFHPDTKYPEYKGATGPRNPVYAAVREAFRLMKLDADNFGTERWNPLEKVVVPGDRVVLKPNFIAHAHKIRRSDWNYVITNGSVIRAVLDYVLIALQGQGEIWIADGPQFDASWNKIVSLTGLDRIIEYARASHGSIPIHALDLRPEWWPDMRDDVINRRESLPGDPAGSQMIDVGEWSAFGKRPETAMFHGSDYDEAETNRHHRHGRHEYLVSRTCAGADVLINLPKMKTHKKVGVTLCLKNLVGINTGRNWLPHYSDGFPLEGGDAFPDPTPQRALEKFGVRTFERWMLKNPKVASPLFRSAKRIGRELWGDSRYVIRNGNWHGNDTCWRMVHDINTCLFYSDGESFPVKQPKRYLGIVDGIIAGEGDGPAAPDPVGAGLIVAGFNPVAVDAAAAWMMGFDPLKLAVIRNAFGRPELPLAGFSYEDIRITSNDPVWNGALAQLDHGSSLKFKAHFGWKGHIERVLEK